MSNVKPFRAHDWPDDTLRDEIQRIRNKGRNLAWPVSSPAVAQFADGRTIEGKKLKAERSEK